MNLATGRGHLAAAATALLVAAGALAMTGGTPASADPERGEGPLFAPLPDFEPPRGDRARVRPDEFAAFDVRVDGVADRLRGAPAPGRAGRAGEPGVVTLPDPDGEPVRFEVRRSRVAEAGFEAAHPELRTWRGAAVGDPTTRLALDVTPMGLHAFVRRPGGVRSWFIDPAENRRGTTAHLSYYGAEVDALPFDFRPPVGGARVGSQPAGRAAPQRSAARTAPGEEVSLRTFRLALVTDPTYADYFGTANVAAEKVTLMNRVNQIYSDDFAVRMLLVDDTEELNLDTEAKAFDADGPCGASGCYPEDGQLEYCSEAAMERNTFVIGQIIGADAYDIGHVALGVNGGGIAGLAVVGDDRKAEGCTGLPVPTGDFFAVDYVAHEMGHQFAANHTFDGTGGFCAGSPRNAATSVEPGSGSSVMAYAGICGQDDLQPHTDPYFSQRSQDEVDGHVTGEVLAFDEVQTISLADFTGDGTGDDDTITLSVPGEDPVEVEDTVDDYNVAALTTQITTLTGYVPTVTGYDGAASPGDDGFTVEFGTLAGADTDVPTIEVATVSGDATGFTGVQVQGGPGTNRGTASPSGNLAPAVTAPDDATIPLRTPFALTGEGTDDDGDDLVYLWEQNDEGVGVGGDALPDNAKTDGPLFRVFSSAALVSFEDSLEYESEGENVAGTEPTRTFPDLAQVLAGHTNADTGTCPDPPADPGAALPSSVRECYAEFLPTSDYAGDPSGEGSVLNFRLTARDQQLEGGGTGFDDVTLTLDTSAGPFRLDSQDVAGARRTPGETETLTWEVNGTDDVDLAPQVSIRLSDDGGATFPHVLAETTPNDGSEQITWPEIDSEEVRLKIEAVDNYFFDVNDAALTVAVDETAPQTGITSDPGRLLARSAAKFRYSSTEAGTFVCSMDGVAVACDGDRVKVRNLAKGMHRFEVAAVDEAGNEDPTPAARRFAVAADDREMKRDGGWSKRRSANAFRGTFLQTNRAGKRVWRYVRGGKRVGVVVGTGPGFGKVDVLVKGKRIRRIDLQGPWRLRKLVVLPNIAKTTGRYTIRSRGGGRVRVDGVAVFAP